MLMSIPDFGIYNHMGMPIIGIFERVVKNAKKING